MSCPEHIKIESRVSVLESNEVRQDERLETAEGSIEKLKDRLPVWATAVIALLMGVAGWLAK